MSLRNYQEWGLLIDRLYKAVISGNVSHAYIVEGDSCIDKERFAKDFVKAILCREEPGYGCDQCTVCRKDVYKRQDFSSQIHKIRDFGIWVHEAFDQIEDLE